METDIFKRPICMKLADVTFKLNGEKHTVNQYAYAEEFIKRTKAKQYANNGLMEITFMGSEYECRLALVAAFTKALVNSPGGGRLSVNDFDIIIDVAVQEPSNHLSVFRQWNHSLIYKEWNALELSTIKITKDAEEKLRGWFGLTPTE